ncbi:MAG: DNA polymerase III subunit beta [Candidatus Kapaibacteriota bacterium]|jgi:DNA polymerase-3 subunit beta
MRLLANLSDLQKGIERALPAIPPKSTLPILEHILFKVWDNNLELTATDQDIIIRTNITLIESEEGAILIPARRLNEILKAQGNKGEIEIIANMGNYDITIVKGHFKGEIKGLDPQEYVDLPLLDDSKFDKEENYLANFTSSEIKRLATKSSFAVSNDEFRLAMTGVFFQFRSTYVNAVSTDSFRLVRVTNFGTGEVYKDEVDLIMPKNLIEILKKSESDVIVYTNKNSQGINTHIRFDFENAIFISRLINEKFPPYEAVLPANNTIIAIVDKTEILSAIKRVSIMANVVSKQIKLKFEGSNLIIYSEDEDTGNKAVEEMFCNFNSELFEIGFNAKYIEEAINNVETDESNEIYLTFSDPNKPALIKPNSAGDNILMLVMPVRLNQ